MPGIDTQIISYQAITLKAPHYALALYRCHARRAHPVADHPFHAGGWLPISRKTSTRLRRLPCAGTGLFPGITGKARPVPVPLGRQ